MKPTKVINKLTKVLFMGAIQKNFVRKAASFPKGRVPFMVHVGGLTLVAALVLLFCLVGSVHSLTSVKGAAIFIEPALKVNGKLYFINSLHNDTLAVISIEIADDAQRRQAGLMFRYNLAESSGMVFVYEKEKKLNFWMKNTFIPLDIIFVNFRKEIITIIENAVPKSETSLPSRLPALYAIEVNAGYCRRNHIQLGDRVCIEAK